MAEMGVISACILPSLRVLFNRLSEDAEFVPPPCGNAFTTDALQRLEYGLSCPYVKQCTREPFTVLPMVYHANLIVGCAARYCLDKDLSTSFQVKRNLKKVLYFI